MNGVSTGYGCPHGGRNGLPKTAANRCVPSGSISNPAWFINRPQTTLGLRPVDCLNTYTGNASSQHFEGIFMLTVGVDGSALGNPGPAGWAWYIDDSNWQAG